MPTATANHALQRTRSAVTGYAPTTFAPTTFPPSLRLLRASLSLLSFGDFSHLFRERRLGSSFSRSSVAPGATFQSPVFPMSFPQPAFRSFPVRSVLPQRGLRLFPILPRLDQAALFASSEFHVAPRFQRCGFPWFHPPLPRAKDAEPGAPANCSGPSRLLLPADPAAQQPRRPSAVAELGVDMPAARPIEFSRASFIDHRSHGHAHSPFFVSELVGESARLPCFFRFLPPPGSEHIQPCERTISSDKRVIGHRCSFPLELVAPLSR